MSTQKPIRLFIDQYGQKEYARTVRELRSKVGGRVSPMYVDGTDGKVYRTGYVVGVRWFNEFTPVRELQS